MILDGKERVKSIRNAFISGLLLMLPFGVTIVILHFLVDRIGAPMSHFFFWYSDARTGPFQYVLDFISMLIVFVLITVLGCFSRYFLGRMLWGWTEQLVGRVPFVNTVYKSVKQIVETFSKQQKAVFQQVVLVEYPRKGVYVLGFLTSTARGEVQEKTGKTVVNVFVPTTPNPTSGFLLMVPEEELTYLQMSVGEGMKAIISGGAVVPDFPNKKQLVGHARS